MAGSEAPTSPKSPKAVPQSPKSPKSPKVAPQSPKAAPQSPKAAPQSPKAAPQSPKAAPQSPKSPEAAEPTETAIEDPLLDTANILEASHWANTALPPQFDDNDSAYGEDAASSTASITSSVLNYRTMNGRRYHAERGNASYWASNDAPQMESMDLYAYLGMLCIGGALHKAPLDEKKLVKALDIGTGTGVWALDFADKYPGCEVIGTDVSPIQPTWVPPNLRFEIEDCTEPWSFKPDSFDYVHMRFLYGSIPDWDALFDEAYRACKPGGWIESHDSEPVYRSDDGSVKSDSALAQWGRIFIEAGRKLGRTFEVIPLDLQIKAMQRLGMEDIEVFDIKCPFGPWAKDPALKEIGRVALATVEEDYEGYCSYVCNMVKGWTKDEVTIYCAHVRREMRHPDTHCYFRQRVVWGRKPLHPKV